jgi:hypothetical protein
VGKHKGQRGKKEDYVRALGQAQRYTETLFALELGRGNHHHAAGGGADENAENDCQ